jgi:hypothetical protein
MNNFAYQQTLEALRQLQQSNDTLHKAHKLSLETLADVAKENKETPGVEKLIKIQQHSQKISQMIKQGQGAEIIKPNKEMLAAVGLSEEQMKDTNVDLRGIMLDFETIKQKAEETKKKTTRKKTK